MSSRNVAFAISAFVFVATGTWWVMNGRGFEVTTDSDALPSPETSVELANPSPPVSQAPILDEDDSGTSQPAELPSKAGAPSQPAVSLPSPPVAAEQPDSDPVLSRNLEFHVRSSINAQLDHARVDVKSVKCRGNSCQILFVDRTPAVERAGPPLVGAMLRELDTASIFNPGTGERLKPILLAIEQRGGEQTGVAAVVAFEKR